MRAGQEVQKAEGRDKVWKYGIREQARKFEGLEWSLEAENLALRLGSLVFEVLSRFQTESYNVV